VVAIGWPEVRLPESPWPWSHYAPLRKSPLGQHSAAQKYSQEALIRDAGNRGASFDADGRRGCPPHRPGMMGILRAARPWHHRHSIMDGMTRGAITLALLSFSAAAWRRRGMERADQSEGLTKDEYTAGKLRTGSPETDRIGPPK